MKDQSPSSQTHGQGTEPMYKRMVLLARNADYDPAKFRRHWSTSHADIIRTIISSYPEAHRIRYTQNRVDEILWRQPLSSEGFDVDGIVELHLTAKTPPKEAFSSGAVAMMLEDEFRFLRGLTECIVGHEGDDAHGGAGRKIIVIAAKTAEATESEFATAVRRAFARDATAAHGVRQACLNWTTATSVREGLLHEPVPPTVLAELWVEGIDLAGQLSDFRLCLDALTVKHAAYCVDALHIPLERAV